MQNHVSDKINTAAQPRLAPAIALLLAGNLAICIPPPLAATAASQAITRVVAADVRNPALNLLKSAWSVATVPWIYGLGPKQVRGREEFGSGASNNQQQQQGLSLLGGIRSPIPRMNQFGELTPAGIRKFGLALVADAEMVIQKVESESQLKGLKNHLRLEEDGGDGVAHREEDARVARADVDDVGVVARVDDPADADGDCHEHHREGHVGDEADAPEDDGGDEVGDQLHRHAHRAAAPPLRGPVEPVGGPAGEDGEEDHHQVRQHGENARVGEGEAELLVEVRGHRLPCWERRSGGTPCPYKAGRREQRRAEGNPLGGAGRV